MGVIHVHPVEGDIGLVAAGPVDAAAPEIEVVDIAIAPGEFPLGRHVGDARLQAEQPGRVKVQGGKV